MNDEAYLKWRTNFLKNTMPNDPPEKRIIALRACDETRAMMKDEMDQMMAMGQHYQYEADQLRKVRDFLKCRIKDLNGLMETEIASEKVLTEVYKKGLTSSHEENVLLREQINKLQDQHSKFRREIGSILT